MEHRPHSPLRKASRMYPPRIQISFSILRRAFRWSTARRRCRESSRGKKPLTKPMKFLFSTICLLAALAAGAQTAGHSGPWELEVSGSTAGLRGIHAVGGGVVWASGTGGTILRSEDGGYEWQQCATPPGPSKLDFRGIWAWDG